MSTMALTTKDQLNLQDEKINVLVMGTSGAGKSTLINAVLGEEQAPTGSGISVTREMAAYESDTLPFRVIDTVGYEYGMLKQLKLRFDIQKWSKDSGRLKDSKKLIHMIWFCTDVQSARVFQEVLDYLRGISQTWKDVPIIVVQTKSYSETEIDRNKKIFLETLAKYRHRKELNIRDVIPVVAKAYPINAETIVIPRGVDELIKRTNELSPDARKLNEKAVVDIDLRLKRGMANSLIAASTTGAALVGAVNIAVPDATLLVPIQIGMLTGVSRIYGISGKANANEIINSIVETGGTTMVGKQLLNALKAVPGLAPLGVVLNAIVAGAITFAAGEVSVTVFERVRRGEIDMKSVDWTKYITLLFNEKMPGIVKALTKALQNGDAETVRRNLGTILSELLKSGH